jgi:tetratricopeptide (TPR) repeat protein
MPSIADLEKLLAAEPHDAFLLYGMALEHAKTNNHAKAIEWYDRCLAADPAYCYAYFHKARSQAALGQTEKAIATLTTGSVAARRAGDGHAASEIQAYLDELS